MNKTRIFTVVLSLISSIGLMAPSGALAQSYNYNTQYGYTIPYTTNTTNGTYVAGVYVPTTCTNLTTGLYKGLRDAATGGQVSALQSFLISQRFLAVAPTGYFGALTYQAVLQYQYAHELSPNGTADVATRASIQTVSCGNNVNNYNYNNGYNNNYNNNYSYNNYSGAPVLSSFSISSAAVGTSVTIYGSGFDLYNNTINFGGTTLAGIPSYAGTALAFTVPQVSGMSNNGYNYNYNYNYNNGYNTTGAYSVTVMTSHGTSNSLSFTVTSGNNNNCYNNGYNGYTNGVYNNCYNGYSGGPISVSNVAGPSTLTAGTSGVWSLTLYNPNSSYVSVNAKWGDENTYGYYSAQSAAPQSSYTQGQQTLTFTHTYQTSGYYTVTFTATDNTGANTSVSATVNVSGSSYNYNQGQPYLSSVSPNSGPTGAQVVLYGSGFTPTGNVIHFGNGGMSNVSASNGGNTIYYNIPRTISGCDISGAYGTICPMYAQQITPGSYPVYISNTYGQSGVLYFTVTY